MAITILQRPIGVILDTCVDATINQDYNGFATVNKTAHGLTDDQWVYVQSNVETYNGFWQIDVINTGEFALRQYDGTYVPYTVSTDITYCPQLSTHGYSCVHLPIVYRISNNRWPVNSIDTVRTISTLNNDLGLARLTLSGSLGTFEDLSFVKISNAANSDYNGVYQILDKLSTTNITLSVAYETFTNAGLIGASIQLYYGNYNVVVQVYAGINSGHDWASVKPYELATTLELIPDENNEVFFSLGGEGAVLPAYVKTKNNLQIVSYPNNTDFWCNFYISTAEQFDSSDGYTVGTTQTGFTSDQSTFEGTGVNAILPFKNIHSGHLSEYLMTNTAAKFLTLFTIPVIFSCGDDTQNCYSDISFLNPTNGLIISLQKKYYSNGVLATTVTTSIGEQSSGVIRAELEAECTYDRVDITLLGQPTEDSFTNVDFVQGANNGTPWVNKVNTITDVNGLSDSYVVPYYFVSGNVYTIDFNITISITGTIDTDVFAMLSNTTHPTYPAQGGDAEYYSTSGVKTGTFSLTATETGNGFLVLQQAVNGALGAASLTLTINSLTITQTTISEEKQFEINCGCADQEIRLTWLNPLGGFDYWVATAETGKAIDITSTTETTKNIFPTWPKSYGENADTIRKQVSRESANRLFITTQFITEDQADALAYIKTSPLVQIINSRTDRRTIVVDSDSFTKYTDNQKLITFTFNARYTDNIGSQKG